MSRMVKPKRSRGQVVVEVLLVLPWFLLIVFTILEMGNIAFHLILVQHATWETARFGAMVAAPKGGSPHGGCPSVSGPILENFIKRVLRDARIVGSYAEATTPDRQAGTTGCDLVVTAEYPIPLIFKAVTGLALSKPPASGKREIQVTLRMPIEQPLFK